MHSAEVADREAVFAQPVLLLDAVLDDRQQRAAGANRAEGRGGGHAVFADLFYLQRNDVPSAGEHRGPTAVVPRGFDAAVDDEARGTAGIGVEDEDAVAHA